MYAKAGGGGGGSGGREGLEAWALAVDEKNMIGRC